MRHIYFIISLFAFSFATCQTKTINFDDAVNSKQTEFPNGEDKKWKGIKELGIHKDDAVCDSLYNIYISIDTSIKGFFIYYDAIFNVLIDINTKKSANTIEKIFSIRHPTYISQSTYVRLSGSLPKPALSIAGLSSHSNYELFFPGILNSLEKDLMNAAWILRLLEKGIREDKISKSQLISFLPKLEAFYNYTEQEREKPEPETGIRLNIYYWISNPILAKCLTSVNNNPIARNILKKQFSHSKNANSNDEQELSWEAFKALDTTLQNDNYLLRICKDIGFRQDAYRFLKEKNRPEDFPAEYNNQHSLSEMICISQKNLRRHDTNKPKKISFIGEKEIASEFYYFYWVCWWEDCKSNSVVVVGPQPKDKTLFNENPKLKGENIKGNVNMNDLQKVISDFKLD